MSAENEEFWEFVVVALGVVSVAIAGATLVYAAEQVGRWTMDTYGPPGVVVLGLGGAALVAGAAYAVYARFVRGEAE